MENDLLLAKQRFFSFLCALPVPNGEVQYPWEDVIFVTLEKAQSGLSNFFAEFSPVRCNGKLENDRKTFTTTDLQYLSLFCNLPNKNKSQGEYVVQYKGEYYFARPLTLWLSPIGFFLFPFDEQKLSQWEGMLKNLNGYLQDHLWQLTAARLEQTFSIENLLSKTHNEFYGELFEHIAYFIHPRQWQTDSTPLHDYAAELYSENQESLKLHYADKEEVVFHLPPILPYVKSQQFTWEYDVALTKIKKNLLENKLQFLCQSYIDRYEDLKQSRVQDGDFPTIIGVIQQLEKHVQEDFLALKEELKDIEFKANRSQKGINQESSGHQFYLSGVRSFHIYFESKLITGITFKPSKLLHVLISHPGISIDMFRLYAFIEGEHRSSESDAQSIITENDEQKLLDYIKYELITLKELEEAETQGNISEYRRRLESGIRLLEKTVDVFPRLFLHQYLSNYQFLFAKYFENDVALGFQEEVIAKIPSINDINKEKKKARERLSTPLKSTYKKLENDTKYHRFLQFLKQTIKVESSNGIHYYTYQPSAASRQEWRDITWLLDQ